VAITDVSGGETLARHASRPGDIWVADRGYAQRPGVGTILHDEQGDVVLRIGWATFPLEQMDGRPFELFPWLRQLPTAPGEAPVQVTTPEGSFRLRLIAIRLPAEAANRARRRIRRLARKKGRMPTKRTLEAAGYLIVVTSLDTELWPTLAVLQLYRLRWQVELIFKRLKSLLHLDDLRAKGPALAQTYLLGKVLAALIIEAWTDQAVQRYPELFADSQRPISAWRWMMWGRDFVFTAVRGPISWQRFLDRLPQLKRYLCISSRQRPNQTVTARNLLSRLLGPDAIGPPPALS
jgi:hypothetical protein